MAGRQSLAPSGPGSGGKDKEKDKRKETVGEWARMAKVAQQELTKCGPEKVQSLHGDRPSQKMPDWVFDNDFEGQPPLNPTEELNRMDKELSTLLAEMDRLAKRSTAVNKKASGSINADQLSPDIASLLEENARQMNEQPKSARPSKVSRFLLLGGPTGGFSDEGSGLGRKAFHGTRDEY